MIKLKTAFLDRNPQPEKWHYFTSKKIMENIDDLVIVPRAIYRHSTCFLST